MRRYFMHTAALYAYDLLWEARRSRSWYNLDKSQDVMGEKIFIFFHVSRKHIEIYIFCRRKSSIQTLRSKKYLNNIYLSNETSFKSIKLHLSRGTIYDPFAYSNRTSVSLDPLREDKFSGILITIKLRNSRLSGGEEISVRSDFEMCK